MLFIEQGFRDKDGFQEARSFPLSSFNAYMIPPPFGEAKLTSMVNMLTSNADGFRV